MAAVATRSGLQIVHKDAWVPDELRHKLRGYSPRSDMGAIIRAVFGSLPAEQAGELVDHISRTVVLESSLSLVILWGPWGPDGRPRGIENLGEVGRKLITDAGVGFLVDAWQNSVELENMKYHALGTGSTAEAQGDTALVTELTTEYTGNVRATGTTTEGATANIFRTVATNTLDGTPGAALREHGLLSQAATGGGVLWDRTVYAAITLSSGDGLQSQYDMTATAGG
jgi:hypothetical protein